MRILILQHIAVEHPGIFRDFIKRDGIEMDTVELDERETLPAVDDYAALMVMGGPMDVWEEDKHPWLIDEKAFIRDWIIKYQKPFLGFCLGHQLMAAALGGEVGKMQNPEVGILDIELTSDGENSSLFSSLPKSIKTLQWHGAEVTSAPPDTLILGQSPACAIQAMQYGDHAFSMQCHIELTDTTVSDWGQIPEYEASLEATMGSGSLERLNIEATKNMNKFNHAAKLIYDNFSRLLNNIVGI